jgi:phosphatidylglycerol:prolipoprotein diacylglycerol transferase
VADAGVAAVLVGNAVGRVGCLRSGCCVGVPGPVGPVYPWLGGVRRRPVQLYEAAACLLIAAGLVALVLAGAPPGRPALAGLGAYAVVRYGLDYLRAERARLGRATEAQWVMAALAAACAAWWLTG